MAENGEITYTAFAVMLNFEFSVFMQLMENSVRRNVTFIEKKLFHTIFHEQKKFEKSKFPKKHCVKKIALKIKKYILC